MFRLIFIVIAYILYFMASIVVGLVRILIACIGLAMIFAVIDWFFDCLSGSSKTKQREC